MDIKIGSYTGNASPLQLAIGFEPDFALFVNGTDGETIEIFFKKDAIDTAIVGAAGPVTNAADGISIFHGEAPGKSLTGLCSIANDTGALTGVSTEFETELQVGDLVKLNDQTFYIVSITSDTAAVVVRYPINVTHPLALGAETSVNGVRLNGRSAGLSLGTDMSEDGDVYYYVALKQD